MTTNQIAADLRAAADVLERDGWTQDNFIKPDGCKCLVGALHAATGDERYGWFNARVSAAREAMNDHLGRVAAFWNDEPGRTADEVVTALRAAADRAEQVSGR